MADKVISVEESISQAIGDTDISTDEGEDLESSAPEEETVTSVVPEKTAEPKAETPEKAEEEPKTPEKEEAKAPEEPQTEATDDEFEIPKFLSDEEKKELKGLPKEARLLADKFLRRRDLSFQRYVTKVRSEAQEQVQQALAPYSGIDEVLMPHVQRLTLSGKDVATTLRSTLEWDQYLDENPVDALSQLCRRLNVLPRQIFDHMQGDGTQGVTPSQDSQAEPNSEVLRRLEAIESENQRLRNEAVNSHWSGVVGQIASAKDAQGQALYPYYQDVREEMAGLLRMVGPEQAASMTPQELFHAAYTKAIWANDNIRAILQNEMRSNKIASNIKKSNAASSLPASNSNGVPTKATTPPSGNSSVEQSIRAAIEQHGVEFS